MSVDRVASVGVSGRVAVAVLARTGDAANGITDTPGDIADGCAEVLHCVAARQGREIAVGQGGVALACPPDLAGVRIGIDTGFGAEAPNTPERRPAAVAVTCPASPTG